MLGLNNEMDIYLVEFDAKAELLGESVYPDLEAYIDHSYVLQKKGRGMCGSWVVCEKYEEDIVFIPENASDCAFEEGYLQVHKDE